MEAYKRIVCCVDFSPLSEAAATRAKVLAQQYGAQLTFLHVIEYFPENRSNQIITPECTDPAEHMEAYAREQLAELAQHVGCADARFDVQFSPHAAWHEIVRYAGAGNCDLVIVGCHGNHGFARLLGSTATGVTNRAPCDVMAVRPFS